MEKKAIFADLAGVLKIPSINITMKFILAALLLIHGLVHLMGLSKKSLTLPHNQQLDHATNKGWWLVSAVLFIISIPAIFIIHNNWWMFVFPAIILSQILIILYWQKAKWGTVMNIIILIPTILNFAAWKSFGDFEMVHKQIRTANSTPGKLVTPERLDLVPYPVQHWIKSSGWLGKPAANIVRLQQQGQLKTSPDSKWIDYKASQYIGVNQPSFAWYAEMQQSPILLLKGLDQFTNGKGQMAISLAGLYRVVNSSGPTIDQGSMVRYLAEICWYPSAALNDYITWTAVDSLHAIGHIQIGKQHAEGLFTFSQNGGMTRFEAMRYMDQQSKPATLEKWVIDIDADSYKSFDGIRIPARSSVSWQLKEGEFLWLKMEITSLTYKDMD